MIAAVEPTWYLIVSSLLFGIGAFGLLVRRNPLVMFMCLELMLNAANLTFVALATSLGDINGQTAVFFVMVVQRPKSLSGSAFSCRSCAVAQARLPMISQS